MFHGTAVMHLGTHFGVISYIFQCHRTSRRLSGVRTSSCHLHVLCVKFIYQTRRTVRMVSICRVYHELEIRPSFPRFHCNKQWVLGSITLAYRDSAAQGSRPHYGLLRIARTLAEHYVKYTFRTSFPSLSVVHEMHTSRRMPSILS